MRSIREEMSGVVRSIEARSSLDDRMAPLITLVQGVTRHDFIKNALSGTWLGHQLHPLLTDVPIGAWTMASALDCISGAEGAGEARRLVGIGVLAAFPAAATGASDWSETQGESQRLGVVHALFNIAATGLQAMSWMVRGHGHRRTGIALSAAGLSMVSFASYLGGHLSFVEGVGVNHTAFQPKIKKWTDVAALTDLSPDKPVRITVDRVPVVLVKHEDTISALSATCVHAGGPLDEGEVLADGCVRCPWHASTFQLATGAVVRGPASLDQPNWDVKIDEERVFVRSSQHG